MPTKLDASVLLWVRNLVCNRCFDLLRQRTTPVRFDIHLRNEGVVGVVYVCPPLELRLHHRVITLRFVLGKLLLFECPLENCRLLRVQASLVHVELVVHTLNQVIANVLNQFLIASATAKARHLP